MKVSQGWALPGTRRLPHLPTHLITTSQVISRYKFRTDVNVFIARRISCLLAAYKSSSISQAIKETKIRIFRAL